MLELSYIHRQLQEADHLGESLWSDNITSYPMGEYVLSEWNYSRKKKKSDPPETGT